jgi:putative protease
MAKKIGTVTHIYGKINVAILHLDTELKVGDMIQLKGKQADFTQKVESIQIEHQQVQKAKKGDDIGLKVDVANMEQVREGDEVFEAEE